MRLYILNRARNKMPPNEYNELWNYFLDEFTSRNLLMVMLYYFYIMFFTVGMEKYFDKKIPTHILCLWMINAVYINIFRLLSNEKYY